MQLHKLSTDNPEKRERGVQMVHARIRMVMPPGMRVEALRILTSVAERTRIEPGCISCRIYQDVVDKHHIMIDESWENKEALERHLRSEDYLKMLLVIEMAIETPEIRFDTIARSTGVDTIKKARNAPFHPAKRSAG
jgi:quinol monooxygenase YgiN